MSLFFLVLFHVLFFHISYPRNIDVMSTYVVRYFLGNILITYRKLIGIIDQYDSSELLKRLSFG